VLAAALAGCSSGKQAAPAETTPVFSGLVVADEPQAALVGRDVLLAGGTAADAATAMYFAMAVTLPSQASLGGGGVCLAFDPASKEPAALEFLARSPARLRAKADRPTAVPGNIRGFFALQGRYGRLRWSQLLAPAENLARFGVRVSRALSHDVQQVQDALQVEPQTRRILSADGGPELVREGDLLVQPDLATMIAQLRTLGPNEFYTGRLGTRFRADVLAAGGSLDATDLEEYQPEWRKPLAVGFDSRKAYFVPPPPAGGALAGQTWAMLVKDGRWIDTPQQGRDATLVDAAARSFADRPSWEAGLADPQTLVSSATIEALIGAGRAGEAGSRIAPRATEPVIENPSAASLLAVDGSGAAVACSVTLNSLFGTGRVAAGSGIVLASLPGPGGRGAAMLTPMLMVRPSGRQFLFAGAAAGGVAAPTALDGVAARTMLAEQPLEQAIAAPRMHGGSDPQLVFAEPGASPQSLQQLLDGGYEAVTAAGLGRVLAISCPAGLPESPERCIGASDPRGFGLAASTD
jgi:gamma-glutamyltranspeptidase/glutathione hydrolase